MTIIVGALALLAAPVAAAPPMVVQGPTAVAIVHITGFHAVLAPTGSLAFQVTLHNSGAAAGMVDVHFARTGKAESGAPHTVHVPAKSDGFVIVTDKTERAQCGLAYDLWLLGDGADPTKRGASMDAQCTFDTHVHDSLNSMTADRRHDAISGKAFMSTAVVPTFTSCNAMKGNVEIENHTSVTATQLVLLLKDPSGAMVWNSLIPAVPAGATHHFAFTATMNGTPGTMSMVLMDPTHAFSDKIAAQTMEIQISPACTATTQLTH